jgi:hypothetical protein
LCRAEIEPAGQRRVLPWHLFSLRFLHHIVAY